MSMDEAASLEVEDSQGLSSKGTVTSDEEVSPSSSCRKSQPKQDKICGVCGDKALGYNFNAITCESCKAFFRRNAFKEKVVSCLFEDNCQVDIRTRRFCPACRIKKCFAVGMNPQMILDDREKKKRLSKVAANRFKKRSSSSVDSPTSASHNPLLVKLKMECDSETMQETCYPDPESTHPECSHSSFTQSEGPATPIGKLLDNIPEEIFKHPSPDLLPEDLGMYRTLLPKDQTNLDYITKAYQNTLAAVPAAGPHSEEKEYQRAADLINYSEIAVRDLIMFVKYLDDFRAISQADQIAILKSCIMHTLLLRSALFYHIEKDAWITPSGEIPSSILKSATGFVDLHNSHVYYCRRVKSMAEDDLSMYALLQILIVFDPAGPNITDRQFVSSIQDRYLILLKHYLESRFSYNYAKEYYVSTIDRLCDLKALSDEHSKILLQIKPVEVEPLMLEVLNLK